MAAYLDLGISITAVNNATAGVRQASNDVKKLGENAQATANRLKAIQVVIAGILINKSIELGRAFAKMAADNQTLDIRMAAFAGSAREAAKVQEELNKKFAASGLVVDDLSQDFIDVRNAVKSNEQGVRLVEAMANAVLALGGGQREVDNLANSFQKVGGRGTVTMRDLNSVIQNTPITLADMARAAGTSSTAFEGALRNGMMNSASFIDAFVKASEQKIGDFSKGLGATIGGAMGYIGNAIDDAIGDLGKRTDINTRLSVLITNIGNSIKQFIGNIDQAKIDAFFDFMQRLEPVVVKTTHAIVLIGKAVLVLVDIITGFLGALPEAAFEYGLIGYALLGKKGFILGALIGSIDQKVRDFGKATDQWFVDHGFFAEYFKADKAKLDKSTLQALVDSFGVGKPRDGGNSIFGSPKQLADWKKAVENLMKSAGSFGKNDPNGIPYMLDEANQRAAELREKIQGIIDSTRDNIDILGFQTSGDEIGEKMARIKKQADGWVSQLEKARMELQHSDLPLGNIKDLEEGIATEIARANAERDKAIAKIEKMYAIERDIFFIGKEKERLSLQQDKVALQRDTNGLGAFQALRGTSGGAIVEQTQDKLLAMQGKFLEYRERIKALDLEQMETIDPGKLAAIQLNIDKYQELADLQTSAMENLNAETEALNQLWQEIGQTIENDISNGIIGLLEGTMSWADVARSIFSDLLSMGVKFLVQLAEMQLFGEVAAASALATAGPVAAALNALWQPAALAASVATLGTAAATGAAAYEAAQATSRLTSFFADGGVPGLSDLSGSIVSGPTLFGMAGEAGDEAILPLTRIGGKLGVRSEGGGGNSFHFHSVDPQSNVKFFMENLPLIQAGLAGQQRMNRGIS